MVSAIQITLGSRGRRHHVCPFRPQICPNLPILALNLPKLAQFLKYLIAFSDVKKKVEQAIKEFESKLTPIKEEPIPFKSPGLPVKRHTRQIDYSAMHSGAMASGTSQRPLKIRKVSAIVPRELGPVGTDMHISSDSSTQDDATGTDNDNDSASDDKEQDRYHLYDKHIEPKVQPYRSRVLAPIISSRETKSDQDTTDNDSDVASDKENQPPNGKTNNMDSFRQDRVPLKVLDVERVGREFMIRGTMHTPPTSGMYLSIISFFKCCMVAQWATKNFEPKKIYF